MTPIEPRRAVPVARIYLGPGRGLWPSFMDADWRWGRARRADRRPGWPFAVFYTGPEFTPRRAKEQP